MKRVAIEQWVVLVLLIVAGSALRLYFSDVPNFAPVAGLALFAGYYFRNAALAAAAPIGTMLITDQLLGGYQPALMLTVYAALTLPVFTSFWLRRRATGLAQERSSRSLAAFAGLLMASCIACSVAFFVTTNLVTWLVTPWYPRTASGLLDCYINAVPFFRYTLAGDLASATTSFSLFFAARQLAASQALPERAA